jgi:hypothetical protein
LGHCRFGHCTSLSQVTPVALSKEPSLCEILPEATCADSSEFCPIMSHPGLLADDCGPFWDAAGLAAGAGFVLCAGSCGDAPALAALIVSGSNIPNAATANTAQQPTALRDPAYHICICPLFELNMRASARAICTRIPNSRQENTNQEGAHRHREIEYRPAGKCRQQNCRVPKPFDRCVSAATLSRDVRFPLIPSQSLKQHRRVGGWPIFPQAESTLLQLRMPHPSRFSMGGRHEPECHFEGRLTMLARDSAVEPTLRTPRRVGQPQLW